MSIPTKIEELKQRMKQMGVSDEDLEKFQDEIDDGDHDMESIKEDISDREQSMLLDFFREQLDGGETIYDYVKSIMDGTPIPPKKPPKDPVPKPKPPPKQEPKIDEDTKEDQKQSTQQKISDSKQNEIESETVWQHQKDPGNDGPHQVILNPGLMIIPDLVITDAKYLEDITGISYVLSYNNAMIKPPRLPYQYVDFWNHFLEEDEPKYEQIAEDIEHNEGPTYDYLMEHPPNDRILPVLEKVVDQLKHPRLDSKKRARNRETYTTDIKTFFETQTPEYYKSLSESLTQTCVLFRQNTNDTNFNTFELFINILDIYDRIFYANEYGITIPEQITNHNQRSNELHFAKYVSATDCTALNDAIITFKSAEKQSFFKKLSPNPTIKIKDNVRDFQKMSLSFILFVKAFMSTTPNCLEKGYHIWKPPRTRNNRNPTFQPNMLSLIDIKRQKAKKNKALKVEDVKVDDGDIFFHNDNMPLQFDFVILPKDGGKEYNNYGLEQKYDQFKIVSDSFTVPTDRDSIYKLYGQFVRAFRNVIKINAIPQTKDPNTSSRVKKIAKRRDDRYCIVMDQKRAKFYMYPPMIRNGNGTIMHRKNINPSKQSEADSNEDKKEEVQNKFSLISNVIYNDLTNFYLTSKCLIPSNGKGIGYFGLDSVDFVLSAHFHQQRQWHRHPKLRFYQYFMGEGLRFLHKNESMTHYTCDKDMIELWPKYFADRTGINEQFIANCDIFDAVLDVYKCDAQYFQWDNAVKRQLKMKGAIPNTDEQKQQTAQPLPETKTDPINEEVSTVMEDDTNRMIHRMCRALKRYYESKSQSYFRFFSTYCDENGFEDDVLEEELQNIDECNLIDFDEDFPYDGPAGKKNAFLFELLQKCYRNPNQKFEVEIPKFDRNFFNISQSDIDETKAIYKKQCTKIFNNGMENDQSFLIMLAIGRKNNFEYLQHLVDDFFRQKIKKFKEGIHGYKVQDWSKNHKHFQLLKKLDQMNVKVLGDKSPYQLAYHAVSGFNKRCCPQMMLTQLNRINDSMEIIVRYIDAACYFINTVFGEASMLKTGRAICPFQFDMSIATGKPERGLEDVTYNDGSDDDEDGVGNVPQSKNVSEWVDCIGNIEQKLNRNGLTYKSDEIDTNSGTELRPHQQIFTKLFNQMEVKSNDANINEYKFYGLHKKRMVGFVDRRESKEEESRKDNVYFYAPPNTCSDIPSDAVGLWYISSARTCLLPDLKYGNGREALQSDISRTETADKLKNGNITAASHCKGGLLTLSFHCKATNEVKMYLYFNGQIIRFMPDDIKDYLPHLFVNDDNDFVNNEHDMPGIMKNIKKVIKDVHFEAFQQSSV